MGLDMFATKAKLSEKALTAISNGKSFNFDEPIEKCKKCIERNFIWQHALKVSTIKNGNMEFTNYNAAFAKAKELAPNLCWIDPNKGGKITDCSCTFDESVRDELFYWRKHPNLHKWFEEKYFARFDPPPEYDFNCVELIVSKEDLLELRQAILNDELPYGEGFFWFCRFKN